MPEKKSGRNPEKKSAPAVATFPENVYICNPVLTTGSPFGKSRASGDRLKFCGNSSVGRASASQAEGREFESRFPLKQTAVAAGYGGLSFQGRKLAFNDLK